MQDLGLGDIFIPFLAHWSISTERGGLCKTMGQPRCCTNCDNPHVFAFMEAIQFLRAQSQATSKKGRWPAATVISRAHYNRSWPGWAENRPPMTVAISYCTQRERGNASVHTATLPSPTCSPHFRTPHFGIPVFQRSACEVTSSSATFGYIRGYRGYRSYRGYRVSIPYR